MISTGACLDAIERLRREISGADAVVVGAGSGLSAASGLTYSGERFEKNFADFIGRYDASFCTFSLVGPAPFS